LKTKAIPLHILAVVKGSGKLRPIRISAVGFCFGGLCALDLARTGPDVRAIASFIVSWARLAILLAIGSKLKWSFFMGGMIHLRRARWQTSLSSKSAMRRGWKQSNLTDYRRAPFNYAAHPEGDREHSENW